MKQFMLASGLALSLGVTAQGANYHVDGTAPKGGDGSAKAPFATIQQAADLAQAGDTVFIKPGTYTETVKPKNSGKEGSPITFRNCPGEEKPTICAGDRVTGPWKDEGGGIYSAACPWNVGSARNHEPAALTNGLAYAGNVVVVDGDLMIEAREPNISGKEQLAMACRLGRLFLGEFRKNGDVVFRGVPGWDDGFWKGGTVWFVGGWNAMSACITNSQAAGADCLLSLGAKKVAFGWRTEGGGWAFLTGAKGALNQEKEFFLDEAAGRLYLMAPGGVDPSGMAVYAKRRFTVIDLTGLNYVVFDRVNTMMGGIVMATATHCALLNSRHLYSSHFYFFTGAGHPLGGDMSRTHREAAAMYISGEENRIEGCEIAYAATGVHLDGRNHVIRNCIITDIYGGSYFSGIQITALFPVDGIGPNIGTNYKANVSCGGHLIERNTISRVSRTFIGIYTATSPQGGTTYQKIRILYNYMSDYMLNTEDGGGVYQWFVNGGGTEVAYNWIHGDHGNYAFNPALYSDNNSLNFRYHHNVIWDVKLGIGWNQTSGYLEAYNNTIWARDLGAKNEAIKVTVAVPGCKIFNNLANQTIGGAGPASSQTNNLVVGGGFVGKPDKPVSGLDFRLATNSPAINAGLVITGITDRAVGAPDVGAYEFGGPEWAAGAGTEPVAPTAPIEFGATAIGAQGIRLGWTDVAFNEKAYVLERSTDGKSWTALATLPANAFAYLDAGFHLKAGTAYQYRLAATNDYGSSAWVSVKASTPLADNAPAITSALTAKTMQGVAFTYTILAANDPAEVTVEGLPKGLAFNPATGVIAGYPEEAGEAKIKLTATNAKGTDTKILALTIAKSEPVAIKGGTVSECADAAGVRWTVLIFTNNGAFTVSGGPAAAEGQYR